jgi:hypothetical protein
MNGPVNCQPTQDRRLAVADFWFRERRVRPAVGIGALLPVRHLDVMVT